MSPDEKISDIGLSPIPGPMVPNGHVNWRSLYAYGTTLLLVCWVVFWAIMEIHSGTPHEGAVRLKEFDMLREDIHDVKVELRALRQEVTRQHTTQSRAGG